MGSVRSSPHLAEGPGEQRQDDVAFRCALTRIEIHLVKGASTLRCSALDREHVLRLVETRGEWPPLLVRRRDLSVIDGGHRLAAAVELGLETIEVELFEGNETDELVEAVKRNASHGLPLTLNERKDAARRLLRMRSEWSDRMLGSLCGLAAGTVKSLREGTSEDAPILQLERRVGRDGRTRPARPAEQRRQIVEALRASPGVSARAIARRVGASAATVRAVSQRLPPAVVHRADATDVGSRISHSEFVEKLWSSDSACSSTNEAASFAGWFDRTSIDTRACLAQLASVPLSRVYEVADESRRRAQVWADFAAALQRRPTALLRSTALKGT